ncbi:carboxymuconolactone decarboxylase family protein [Burkholderia plantarii]|uniref:carboxymuconolactone decarboxylase family protein n=1 Tax=Burkholderia plantarii TaxID=41899 RepID=UPI0018DBA1CF|nr:carboxymuconolactone decarboxylase family protein [Burkholderia plantarii]MBI0328725.1 carboxymuconolactone decarboxylase family protein [Burkholderia plantarii]
MSEIDKNSDLLQKFNPDGVRLAKETVHPVFPDLVDKIVSDIYGFAYRRPILDMKTRHLVTLAAIAAMGGAENQLTFQLGAALNLGISADEVREVFMQVAVFAGNVRAFNAAAVFKSVLDERVKEK